MRRRLGLWASSRAGGEKVESLPALGTPDASCQRGALPPLDAQDRPVLPASLSLGREAAQDLPEPIERQGRGTSLPPIRQQDRPAPPELLFGRSAADPLQAWESSGCSARQKELAARPPRVASKAARIASVISRAIPNRSRAKPTATSASSFTATSPAHCGAGAASSTDKSPAEFPCAAGDLSHDASNVDPDVVENGYDEIPATQSLRSFLRSVAPSLVEPQIDDVVAHNGIVGVEHSVLGPSSDIDSAVAAKSDDSQHDGGDGSQSRVMPPVLLQLVGMPDNLDTEAPSDKIAKSAKRLNCGEASARSHTTETQHFDLVNSAACIDTMQSSSSAGPAPPESRSCVVEEVQDINISAAAAAVDCGVDLAAGARAEATQNSQRGLSAECGHDVSPNSAAVQALRRSCGLSPKGCMWSTKAEVKRDFHDAFLEECNRGVSPTIAAVKLLRQRCGSVPVRHIAISSASTDKVPLLPNSKSQQLLLSEMGRRTSLPA